MNDCLRRRRTLEERSGNFTNVLSIDDRDLTRDRRVKRRKLSRCVSGPDQRKLILDVLTRPENGKLRWEGAQAILKLPNTLAMPASSTKCAP